MKPQIQAKLQTLSQYPFFQSVGKRTEGDVMVVNTWPIALGHYGSTKWENCRFMASNVLQTTTEVKSWHRADEWNSIVVELRPLIRSFIDGILAKSDIPEAFKELVKSQFVLDLLFICLEAEYADVVVPPFFIPVLEPWYAMGHVPCGWDGKVFPEGWDGIIRNGRLIVF